MGTACAIGAASEDEIATHASGVCVVPDAEGGATFTKGGSAAFELCEFASEMSGPGEVAPCMLKGDLALLKEGSSPSETDFVVAAGVLSPSIVKSGSGGTVTTLVFVAGIEIIAA